MHNKEQAHEKGSQPEEAEQSFLAKVTESQAQQKMSHEKKKGFGSWLSPTAWKNSFKRRMGYKTEDPDAQESQPEEAEQSFLAKVTESQAQQKMSHEKKKGFGSWLSPAAWKNSIKRRMGYKTEDPDAQESQPEEVEQSFLAK